MRASEGVSSCKKRQYVVSVNFGVSFYLPMVELFFLLRFLSPFLYSVFGSSRASRCIVAFFPIYTLRVRERLPVGCCLGMVGGWGGSSLAGASEDAGTPPLRAR